MMELIAYLIVFCAGMYCGHIVSPWIDHKVSDLRGESDE
jgi:hypothetical protein